MEQSLNSKNMVRRVAGLILLYLGDLNKFRDSFEHKTDSESGDKFALEALEFYNRAKTISPHEGKVYSVLG